MQFLKTKNKTILIVIGLTTLGISSAVWLIDKGTQPQLTTTLPEQSKQTDYFMENYHIISIDSHGNPFRWLSGPKLAYFNDGQTQLEQPTLQFHQQKQHWLLTANNGNIHNNDKISLKGKVEIQQLSGQAKSLDIKTEQLEILLPENIASTNNNVLVSSENGEIRARGMRIDFNNHQLSLLSQVKGRYVFD